MEHDDSYSIYLERIMGMGDGWFMRITIAPDDMAPSGADVIARGLSYETADSAVKHASENLKPHGIRITKPLTHKALVSMSQLGENNH